ncbi:MAG: hypothetical protein EOM67_00375 [Spirochaetia bacterium]|nr:hypothetical protein [Spirochaetia bacterium]
MPKIVKLEDGSELNVWMEDEVTAKVNEEKEKARKEEKDKLYSEIKTLKEKTSDLEAAKAKAEKMISEASAELITASANDANKDKEKDVQMKEELVVLTQGLEKKISNLENELKTERLARYKAEKIAQEGTDLIIEMVQGNSEEEIDNSITLAKEAFAKYAKPKEEKKETQDKPPVDEEKVEDKEKEKKSLPPKSKETPEGGKDVLSAEQINKMSIDEYRKYRDQIKKQVKYDFEKYAKA